MCSDLRSVAKWTHKFPRQQTKVEKTYYKANISCISLANNMLMEPLRLGLGGGQTVKNLCENFLSNKVTASHRKSTLVHARSGQTESQIDSAVAVRKQQIKLVLFNHVWNKII